MFNVLAQIGAVLGDKRRIGFVGGVNTHDAYLTGRKEVNHIELELLYLGKYPGREEQARVVFIIKSALHAWKTNDVVVLGFYGADGAGGTKNIHLVAFCFEVFF